MKVLLNACYGGYSLSDEFIEHLKTFDNYEVFWEDERAEIDLWHKLQTDYDFKEANKATQKALT
jgi:hypothetical protein